MGVMIYRVDYRTEEGFFKFLNDTYTTKADKDDEDVFHSGVKFDCYGKLLSKPKRDSKPSKREKRLRRFKFIPSDKLIIQLHARGRLNREQIHRIYGVKLSEEEINHKIKFLLNHDIITDYVDEERYYTLTDLGKQQYDDLIRSLQ